MILLSWGHDGVLRPLGVSGRGGTDMWTFDYIAVPVTNVMVEEERTVGAQRNEPVTLFS